MYIFRLALALSFIVAINTIIDAQKVKFKDGEVFVNKELKYTFESSEDDQNKDQLKTYVLKDTDGTVIFTMSDSCFYYDQLANEIAPRCAYRAYLCSAPAQDLSGLIPYNPIMNYPKQRIKDLDKAGFFKKSEMNGKVFNSFLDRSNPKYLNTIRKKIEESNTNRTKNYKLTESKFGPLLERQPGKVKVVASSKATSYIIMDGATTIGKYLVTDKDSYKPGAIVFNGEEVKVAHVTMYNKPVVEMGISKIRSSLKPYVYGQNNLEENFRWFYENEPKLGTPKSIKERLEEIAIYMVNEGLL